MKQKFLFSLRAVTMLLVMCLSVGNVWGATYTKVSSVTAGNKYLVVYYASNKYYVFNGSNPSNGGASADITFSPTNNVATGDFSSYTVTITNSHTSGKYLVQSASGKYMGRSNNSNGMDLTDTKPTSGTNYDNAITYNSTSKYFVIAGSGGRALGSNSNSWKYYSSSNAYTHLDLYEEGSSFTIAAVANPSNAGSVSVSGTTITATPNSGYRVKAEEAGYKVTEGTATVVNNGDNTFAVTPATNCSIQINFEVLPTHKVKWSVNGNVTEVDYAEGAAITFNAPTSGIPTGKTFTGWTASTITGTQAKAPEYVTSATMGQIDITYYAVFATASIGTDYAQITAENDLEEGGRYLIVGNSSSSYNALPVDKAASLTSVSPSSSKISSPDADLIWTLEGSADAWKIKSVSNNEYLQISGGNLTFVNSTSLTFSVSVSSSKFTFTSSATSGNKVLSYYHNGGKFNAYTSANTVYVYKASINYSDYCTTAAASHTVTLNTNGGTIADGKNVTSYSEGTAKDLPTASDITKTGNTFQGWFDNSSCEGTAVIQIPSTATTNVEYWAKWQVNSYTLTWTLNDGVPQGTAGTDYTAAGSVLYGATLTAPVLVKTGYAYVWDPTVPSTMPAGAATYAAIWTAQKYDITYKDQGDAEFSGTGWASTQPTKHTYGTATTLVNPTKVHHTFVGWYSTPACDGTAITQLGATDYTAAITLYAKWQADPKYAATFYVNGDVYGTAVEYFEGQSVVFPATNPSAPLSCSDKVFTGWTNEANKDYKSETTAPTYVMSHTMGTEVVNFYAVFADASGESNDYVKGALSELQTGKKVVLVHPGTTNYAVSSASSTENYLDAVSVAIASQKITSPATALIWQVTKNDNLYKFDQGVSKILRVNDTGLYASSTDASFMISTRSSSYELKDASVSAYIDYWTNFTTYSSSHNDNCIDFYIQSIAYSNYATKCKECENAITITKGTESNGKFELSKTGVVCLDDVQGGYSVTVTADPDEHYHFASVSTSSGNAGTISDNQCVVSGITANTTITAVFEMDEKVTVTWHVNGATSTTTNVYEGTAFADVTGKPSVADNATDCGNKFMGWATALITKEEATASDVSWATETTISSSNKDFYAVWATEDGSQGGSYTLNFSDASEYDLGYGVQQEVTAEDGSKWVVKAYKGNDGMQINKGKNSSIKIPTCPGNISSINIIGSASVIVGFSADDYSGGDVSDVSYIVLGSAEQDQTLDFTGKEVKAGYVVPNGGSTQISKVVVNYGGGTTASNYITTCAAAVNHTLTVEVSPASSGTITNPTTSSVELAENKGTQALAVTAAEGYGFKTWQFNGEASGATLNNPTSTTEASVKMGTANITLTAVFAPLRTVTLSNGQDPEATQVHGQYIAETEIAVPANPFKVTGKKFNGWQVEGVAVTGATYTMPDKDVKFVAQWVDAPATMWELVEDAKDLKDGDLFIMAYISQSAKYTAGSNVNNRYLDKLNMNASCFEDEYLVSVPEGTQLFTLVSVPNNLWKLQNEKGEVLAAYKAQSYIYWQTEDLLDDEDVPTYTIANSAPKTGINIVCSTTNYGRLCVNTASPRFANYTNTTDGYPNPSIYRYKGSTYKLTFDANGGEDAPTTQSTTFGSNDITITSVKPTRENYDFLCWNTKENGSGTNYSAGDVITLSDNTTLYAKWLLHQEYSVIYDINGGTGTTPVDATKYVAGDYVTLKPATGFTKVGYNFVGWIDKNGYYYTAGSSDEFEMPVGGATLKALWYSAYSFTRVTDVNSLHEGDKIIIVDRTSELVAGDVYDDTYLEQILLSGIASNNTTNKVPYEGNVFTLKKDNDGYWNLINWEGSKLSAGNKQLTYDGSLDYWEISIEGSGAATLTVTDGSMVYKMWSNYGSSRFACYIGSQTGMHVPQIYRLDNYTREAGKFSNGKISTVCLPYAVNEPEDIVGCTVYKVTGKELQGGNPYKVFFDQVFSMEAGVPYVVELDENATEAKFFYSGTAVDEPNNKNTNGLVGTFEAIDDLTEETPVLEGNYMIYSNQIKKCGTGCLVGKNKAYIKMNLVPEENGSSTAPGRRLTLGVEQAQTPTDLDNVNANENANVIRKVIIDNQMFIIRGGKMYNASGALVK